MSKGLEIEMKGYLLHSCRCLENSTDEINYWTRVTISLGVVFCKCQGGGINYGLVSNTNWTEWSAIQGVIARVISKSDEREARSRFEITSKITS